MRLFHFGLGPIDKALLQERKKNKNLRRSLTAPGFEGDEERNGCADHNRIVWLQRPDIVENA